jgi:hypothetical protein
MDYADNAITINRDKIKEALSLAYKNANYWTLEAYIATNAGKKGDAKICLSQRDKSYSRISGIEEFLYTTAGISVQTFYVDDREYHMYGYPRIAHLEIYWGDERGKKTEIVEIQGGEAQE